MSPSEQAAANRQAHESVIEELRSLLGPDWVKTEPSDLENYGRDWTRQFLVDPLVAVLPKTVDEVVAIVKLARQHGVAIVPSGGRTGLSGGAVAGNGEIVLAFDRMNQIVEFSSADRQVVCEAGVVTEQLQQFATDKGLFYPVDFASSGSSQIGGNVATNAGGIKVIRYGMTRSWVMGLKVVTGSGEVLNLNGGLVKNATGYDLRQLFIGSEGTLGLIVEVTVGLAAAPKETSVLVLGLPSMRDAMPVLEAFQQRLELTAFEFFSERAMGHVIAEKQLPRPFATASPFYALIEFENRGGDEQDTAMALFEHCLEQGWIEDGVISQSLTQAESLWRLREDISESISRFTPYKNDISVRVSKVPEFLEEVDRLVTKAYPDFEIIWFGHIGDGNVHLNILKPDAVEKDAFFASCSEVSKHVFEIVQRHNGSISAEHGVGLLKKPYLGYSRSDEELALMRGIKSLFDPDGILNPGKIF